MAVICIHAEFVSHTELKNLPKAFSDVFLFNSKNKLSIPVSLLLKIMIYLIHQNIYFKVNLRLVISLIMIPSIHPLVAANVLMSVVSYTITAACALR